MEKQLKLDAWHEVRQGGEGQLLLHDEDSNGNLICFWEKVSEDGLKTPREEFDAVFEHVRANWQCAQPSYKFTAAYHRTPITDEVSVPPLSSTDTHGPCITAACRSDADRCVGAYAVLPSGVHSKRPVLQRWMR